MATCRLVVTISRLEWCRILLKVDLQLCEQVDFLLVILAGADYMHACIAKANSFIKFFLGQVHVHFTDLALPVDAVPSF